MPPATNVLPALEEAQPTGASARSRSCAPSVGGAVLLEERIAVGDPGCRVVVSLVPPPPEAAAFAHHYRAPVPADPADPADPAGERP